MTNTKLDVAISISRFKKDKFLLDLTEDDFRDLVIRPLFLRLGYRDGRDLCGPTEYGKDAVFLDTTRLGQEELVAVQTKRGNLNLTSKASQNLANATAQVRTALETTIPLIVPKRKVVPAKVYLCASGKINDAARNHICDQITDPRITFLDADELVPLIDKHFPELWLRIDADLLPYFRAIKTMIEGGPTIPDDAPLFKSDILIGAATDKSFINLTLFRTSLKPTKTDGLVRQKPTFEELSLERILQLHQKRIMILGEAGSGKSTALLRLAYQCVRDGVHSSTRYTVPVFIRCVDLVRAKFTSVAQYIADRTKELANTDKSCFTPEDLAEGRVLLLVDALDELPDDASRKTLLGALSEFSHSFPEVKIVISSRPYRFVHDLPDLRAYAQYNIAPLAWKDANKILSNLQRGKNIPISNSQEILRRLEHVHGMELNPLLVTVFAATAEYSRQDIPANITELFKKFTELMLGRWDENKGLSQQYQAPLKDFLLTKLAFAMHCEKQTSYSMAAIKALVSQELAKRGHKAAEAQILDELVNRSGLFRIISDQVEFRHHLLQEFFAGRGIPDLAFLEQVADQDWWQRAVVFNFGENPDQAERLQTILQQKPGPDPESIYIRSITVGLSLQACYLSEVDFKLQVWKQVAQTVSLSLESVLNAGFISKYPLSAFLVWYFYAREALALSQVSDSADELIKWARNRDDLAYQDDSDAKTFWIISSLIELGELDLAENLLDAFHPQDSRYLVALHLGATLTKEVRAVDEHQKDAALRICRKLDPAVTPFIKQIVTELGSQLIETRRGVVQALDSAGNITSPNDADSYSTERESE